MEYSSLSWTTMMLLYSLHRLPTKQHHRISILASRESIFARRSGTLNIEILIMLGTGFPLTARLLNELSHQACLHLHQLPLNSALLRSKISLSSRACSYRVLKFSFKCSVSLHISSGSHGLTGHILPTLVAAILLISTSKAWRLIRIARLETQSNESFDRQSP